MKLETSPKVTKSKRSLHWCRSISKKYLCRFYYSISQKVITLSGRRFITVSGVLLHYRAVITLSGVFYYIIGRLLQYRAFITLSVGTTHETRTSSTYCLDNDKTHFNKKFTVHFINFSKNIFSESSLTRSGNYRRHLIRSTPFPVSVTLPRVRYLLCFAITHSW